MSPRLKLGLAAGTAGLGLVALLGLLFGTRGSVQSHIASAYTKVSSEQGGRSAVFSSPDPPGAVVSAIAGRWKPAERINDPGGYFLRYRNSIVAVTPDQAGSRIYVDDEQRGYGRWYPYIGGRWGTYSGPGETFRGGGPAAGK